MKVCAYTALHYGKEYLRWAIHSVIDSVDEYVVLYSAVGSHGSRTDIPCPDTRDELIAEAKAGAGKKLVWYDGEWPYEGAQRDTIFQVAPDADVILVLDADEIWSQSAVELALLAGHYQQARNYRVPMVHYWRSFHRCVLHDPAYPTRVILPKVKSGEDTLSAQNVAYPVPGRVVINHMGYSQSAAVTEYKQLTHGHKGEWRKDDWFHTVFMANAQTNCHPVGSEYWNPEPVDPWQYMPDFMKMHPYATLEVIP